MYSFHCFAKINGDDDESQRKMTQKLKNMKTIPLTLMLACIALGAKAQPNAYPGLPESHYHRWDLNALKSDGKTLQLPIKQAIFAVPNEQQQQLKSGGAQSISFESHNEFGHLNVTLGHNSAFGEWHHQGKTYRITTEASGTWLVELPLDHLQVDACGTDHASSSKITQNVSNKQATHTIDVLVIYDQALADRYPGEALNTRIDHYFHVANQTMANSGLDIDVRLVGTEQVPYNHNNANIVMLDNIQTTLAGTGVIQGLQDVPQMRLNSGADLVIAIRPHDIETRGNCGVAYYPAADQGFDSSFGVNMVSDGMSSWSLCSDQVFIHEIGHNLGAAHQYGQGGGSYQAQGSAFVKLYQFNTVMGSFGTARNNRSKRLPMFSNPSLTCGGEPCGLATGNEPSNNVAVINSAIGIVANYLAMNSNAPFPSGYVRSDRDADGDGVIDWDDHFPFDASEQVDSDGDGSGNNKDAFPNDPNENNDNDSDGIGDNADEDDDNDQVTDLNDAFPFDANEFRDADFDGVGDNSDAFPNDPTEQLDFDQDGLGDHQDDDDDNDQVIDVDTGVANTLNMDLLVLNAGDNRVLRFDAHTGRSLGIEVLPDDGVLTFQSDLSYDWTNQRLYYTSSSGVKFKDMMKRNGSATLIPAYPEPPFSPTQTALNTGFPTSLMVSNNQVLVSRIDRGTLSIYDKTNPQQVFQAQELGIASPELEESFIDIEWLNDNHYLLGLQGRLYKGTTQSGFAQINQVGDPALREALDMTLTPAGHILVSDAQRQQILQYDEQGKYQSIFADFRLLNLGRPSGMTVVNGLHVLVASQDGQAIHQFNIADGAYQGPLVEGQGLNQPHKIIAIPSLIDRHHHDANKVIRPNAGQWFAQSSAGRGFDIQVSGNRLNVIWYTYDDDGLPTWYISAGDLVGFEYQSHFDRTQQIDMDNVSLEQVGDLNITFINEREAEVNWRIGQDSGSETIGWHPFSHEPTSTDRTGLWGRPDGPGWGVSLATIGEVSVAIAFIYDQAGNPRWVISEPTTGSETLTFNQLFVTSDTLCPGCTGQSSFNTAQAGTMTMSFTGEGDWDTNISWPAPVNGSWQTSDVKLFRFSSEPTRPR